MRTFLTLSAVAALLFTPSVVESQERWSAELTLGGALPTSDVGTTSLDPGIGFEGTVAYRLMPHLWGYGGWDWHRFSAEGDAGEDFEETGYAFGVRFEHPFSGETSGPAFMVRAGGTYNHIEVESADGDLVADSGHGLGWEVGGGIVLPLGEAWAVTPGVRYRALSRDLTMGAETTTVNLEYVAFEITVARRF